jgi:hypothetical protein
LLVKISAYEKHLHVGFGLANPAISAAMYGDPHRGGAPPAATQALAVLRERMRSLAPAGRLRIDEGRAVGMVRAAACGVVFILLEKRLYTWQTHRPTWVSRPKALDERRCPSQSH